MEILRGVRTAGRVLNVRRLPFAALFAFAVFAAPDVLAAQLPGAAMQSVKWPVRTREHVDLWLHGFAMISADTSPVPLFRRGYRETLIIARTKASAVTDLDVNRDALAKRLRENPALINAQFLAFSFATWEELVATIDAFVKADGDAKKAKSRESAAAMQVLARIFPAKADRDFARTFTNALQNERDVFFHRWWVDEMRRRDRTLAAVDAVWHGELQPKLQGFMNHSDQGNGELLLSLALEGEGRAAFDAHEKNQIAVGFPDSPDHAMDAMFALAHELVGQLVAPAVDDNTTPAEKRSGVATTIGSYALVRGGELLMAHLSPELGASYARFYLNTAGVEFSGDPMPAFSRTFQIPAPMLNSIARQISISFGGI